MHDEIVRYSLDGEVSDNHLLQTKERLIMSLESQMRDEGCVPSLDILPQFTLDYQPSTDTYLFQLSVYGVYRGNGESWQSAGVMDGKPMQRNTQRVR